MLVDDMPIDIGVRAILLRTAGICRKGISIANNVATVILILVVIVFMLIDN